MGAWRVTGDATGEATAAGPAPHPSGAEAPPVPVAAGALTWLRRLVVLAGVAYAVVQLIAQWSEGSAALSRLSWVRLLVAARAGAGGGVGRAGGSAEEGGGPGRAGGGPGAV